MASQIKHKVVKNIYETLQTKVNVENFNSIYGNTKLSNSNINKAKLTVFLPNESNCLFDKDSFLNSQAELLESKTVTNIVYNDMSKQNFVEVELDLKHFIKNVVDSNLTKLNFKSLSKKILIEFSSPNIAKPFHVGHLRSTIIGNSLANINKKFGNEVVKLNYLGDWGTQFGIIQLGMSLGNYTEEDLKKSPLLTLFKAYVRGNTEAEADEKNLEKAKKIFLDLETEKEEITKLWQKYRQWTLEELDRVYNRLGVSFDEYSWESDYKRKKADRILELLKENGILSVEENKRHVAVVGEKKIPLTKSDDTTLYILRDLMAVEERRLKHKCNEMYYVVSNGQSEHFTALFELCSKLKLDEGVKLEHVKFGKVQGMSTRKGKVVFLSDVLDEAQNLIYQKQKNSKHTKVSLEDKAVADILGVSVILISELKQKRLRDYEFSWDRAVNLNTDSGVGLQYCHSRLCNLGIESGCSPALECDPEALLEPEAMHLTFLLAKYDEFLWKFLIRKEPCSLTCYIFELVKAINAAYKRLNVKNAGNHVSSQRLLLFNKSREVLNDGMKILGLQPLAKM